MTEAIADGYDEQHYTGGDDNSGTQHIGDGDVNGPMIGEGGQFIGVNGDAPAMEKFAESITVNTVREPGKPEQPVEIKKLRRWPTPTGVIGIVSGLITIAGVFPGIKAYRQVEAIIDSPGDFLTSEFGVAPAGWWLLGTVLVLSIGAWGFGKRRFLRKHILWLPRWSWRRARAGICAKNGKTYPCSIRLAASCRVCGGKMRFYNKMIEWVDHYDAQGNRRRREGTRWEPRAECKRNPDHWVKIDIARNDFDKPIH